MKKLFISLLMALVLLIFPAVSQAKLTPGDYIDIQGNSAEPDIQLLDQLGIMNGMGTNAQGYRVFAPDKPVSRAQMAKVLTDTFKLDYGQLRFFKQPVASDYYRDVENDSWYANAVVMCAINNIFNTQEGYNFKPSAELTRIEAASAIYRSFNAKKISIPMIMSMPVFNDTNDLEQEDSNALVFVINTGIMSADGQNFKPNDPVTRADLAEMISRCIKLTNLNEDYNGKDYSVKTGQTFILSLAGNPTTGYSWDFSQPVDNKLLQLVTNNAYQSDASSGQTIVGQGGRSYWEFKALQPGTTEIELRYARPWESVQPAKTFKITITISAAADAETTQGVTVQTKAHRNLAQYMETDLNIPLIQGMNDASIQKQLNDRFEKDAFDLITEVQTGLDDYVKTAQLNKFPINNYVFYSRFQQGYLSNRILSLTVDYYQYTGGAHGTTERRPYNVDLSTGSTLALKDLFKDNYDYAGIINTEIRRQISANADMYFSDDMGFKGISADPDYYLQNGSLIVYFQQYEIAPYAAGIPEFKIPLSQFGNNLKSELLLKTVEQTS